jgi:preprotein translocase subunit SecD
MRISLLAPVVAALVCLAGCQASVDGRAVPAPATGTSFGVVSGSALRFRKVTDELPPGPPAPTTQADRQSADPAVRQAVAQALDCTSGSQDPLAGHDDPALPLVTCDRTDGSRYLLEPAFLTGSDVRSVSVGHNGPGYVINLAFKSEGAQVWGTWTSQNAGQRVAMVLNTRVLSAPTVQGAILGGVTQISGNFTEQEARQLAHDIAGG